MPFATLVLEGMCDHHAQAFLLPGNTQYPMYRRVVGPWGHML